MLKKLKLKNITLAKEEIFDFLKLVYNCTITQYYNNTIYKFEFPDNIKEPKLEL